jgi:hypothetical protein
VRSWLQLMRAQTAPATLTVVLTPYLSGTVPGPWLLVLAPLLLLTHYVTFGHNSLMDTAMGYDLRDPSKGHHPLVSGAISLHAAHNAIHWGLVLVTASLSALTLRISPSPGLALAFLSAYLALGHAYNDGLSKESPLGFIAASCSSFMAVWAWLLSHAELEPVILLYMAYTFILFAYQISYSGFLKDIGLAERSNIMSRMGAGVRDGVFVPGRAGIYAWALKASSIAVLAGILHLRMSTAGLLWIPVPVAAILVLLRLQTVGRPYRRDRELKLMSLMEIFSIYAPVPLLVDPVPAAVLMASGVVYFYGMNAWLWGASFPRV